MNRGLALLFALLLPLLALPQDPGFSQFYANPLHLNPAFTGTTELARAVVNYRNQWPQQGATYTTYSLSYDQIVKKTKTGLGFLIMHDRELNNVIQSTNASATYSYHLQFDDDKFMTLGMQGGIGFKQYNLKNLVFPSEIDQLTGEISELLPMYYTDGSKLYPDFSVGALSQVNDFYFGASVHHLGQPNVTISKVEQQNKLPLKVSINLGARSRKLHHGLLSREFTVSPNLLYLHQGSFKQLNIGIYLIEKSFQFGGWFRSNFDARPDAFILLAGFARERFQFGYSFDLTLSKLSNYSYGSHEISMTFYLGSKSVTPVRNKLLIPMI